MRSHDQVSYQRFRVSLLDSAEYEHYKMAYSEILHRWCLLDARAQVMKYVSSKPEIHQGLEPVIRCSACKQKSRECYCSTCKIPALSCVICHMPVKGSANACSVCGHGGHLNHISEWFHNNAACPSGCGCLCGSDHPETSDSQIT